MASTPLLIMKLAMTVSPYPAFPRGKAPLLNPLMEQLAIRLTHQKTMGKSLVIPQAGEEANEESNLQFQRDNQRLGCGRLQPSRMASCFTQKGQTNRYASFT